MLRAIAIGALLAVSVAFAAGGQNASAESTSSTQFIFSDTGGTGTFNGHTNQPFGFWIWCTPATSNAYGPDCAGSMYFYSLATPAQQVDGTATPVAGSNGFWTIHVESTPHDSLSFTCTLANSTATPGPTNTVTVSCTFTSPSGSFSGTVNNAVVQTSQ
jgi:hypothetical protein